MGRRAAAAPHPSPALARHASAAHLAPGQEAIDQATWRTLPPHLAAAGKGLQLLFRLATYKDIKPPEP